VLAAARDGRGGVAIVEGPPGIGKTRLLETVADAATRRGVGVLAARGGDLERELPFGVVRQLFERSLRRAEPQDRTALLAGPAALASSVLLERHEIAPERSAAPTSASVLHGLYWLTSNLAERAPLLLAVDDAHWSDAASLRFLHYLVRRIGDLPVLVVVTLRPMEPEARAELVTRIRAEPLATVLRPAPLTREAAAGMVRARLGGDAARELGSACHQATDGNPFLLSELIGALQHDGVAPTAHAAEGIAGLVPPAVTQHVLARLVRLPPAARSLGSAVAVLGAGADLRRAGELVELDEATAAGAADALAGADLLVVGTQPGLDFVHPLVREAVYADLAPGERLRLHARAARLLEQAGDAPDRVAAQLLVTTPLDEGWAVGALRDAAAGALASGAPESAAAYLRRALQEPLDPGTRADVVFELGQAEARVEGAAATARLDQALRLAHEPGRRAAIGALLARRLFYEGRPADAVAICERALTELDTAEPDLRGRLETEQLLNAMFEPALIGRTGELVPEGLLAGAAWVATLAGLPAPVVTAHAQRALEGGALAAADDGGPAFVCAVLVLAAADSPLAPDACAAGLAAAQEAGNGFAFATVKAFTCRMRVFRGEIVDAVADGTEALAASELHDIAIGPAYACAFLADALVERGELDAAEEVLERAGAPAEIPDNAHWHPFMDSRARVLFLCRRLREALREALECGRRYEAMGGRNPAWVPWRSRAALCLAALDEDAHRARRLIEEEVELAAAFGAPRALGHALCVRGKVVGGDDGLRSLGDAVDALAPSAARLEHARALCALGAALRRQGRREAAREPLRRAMELAYAGGARAVQEEARSELLASGARPRRIPVSGVDSLTPSERRVAAMAADGLTNREIAQALFVSLKTVEMHLSRAYRKLDLSSRSELARALMSA
jgi:DNA-binding CsgD family transcriptional regulator